MATTKTDTTDLWKELRKPFPKEAVGKLKTSYGELDYVGHAAVTDRLNSVDPTWEWRPMAITETGLPAIDEKGNLWIYLTVLGVTRIGVGDGKNAKELIGDAIRNGAMRFGVALELWSKDDLESNIDNPTKPDTTFPEDLPVKQVEKVAPVSVGEQAISNLSLTKVRQGLHAAEITGEAATAHLMNVIGKPAPTTEEDAEIILALLSEAE